MCIWVVGEYKYIHSCICMQKCLSKNIHACVYIYMHTFSIGVCEKRDVCRIFCIGSFRKASLNEPGFFKKPANF